MTYPVRYIILCLLLFGVLQIAQAQNPPPDDDPNVTIHIVQRGENLFRVAQRYGLTTEQLARVNNITNPDSILVGQRLVIPSNGADDWVASAPLPTAIHRVSPGENLRGIANFYGTTVEDILQLNNLTDPNRIVVGQELRINDGIQPPFLPSQESVPLDNAATITHIIQRGETLFAIATTYGVTMADIQTANSITNPSRILAGQELLIPGASIRTPADTRDLPSFIVDLTMNPLTLIEGLTGRLSLRTTTPATITATFLNREISFLQEEGGLVHIAFLPVPIFTQADIYTLSITAAQTNGQNAVILLNIQVNAGNYDSQQIILPEDKISLLSPGVEENETNILRGVVSRITPERYFQRSMSLPAAAAMNSPFGGRRSYNGSPFDRYHTGADFAGAPGSPVLAAASGRVVLADTLNIRGVSIVIDHGWGVYTVYSHMTDRLVNIGDFINIGQTIGTVGNTGRATGAHLHWEVWVHGVPVDPMQWVRETFP